MNYSLKICLLEASEPAYGRSPDEVKDDTILYFVMRIPKSFPKTREKVLDALVADDVKKALEILDRQIDNFTGTDRGLLYDLMTVRDLIKYMKRGDFTTMVTQQGFDRQWDEENR